MIYKSIELRERSYSFLYNEILFTLASERCDGVELVRFEPVLVNGSYDIKIYNQILRIAKIIKNKRIIQFYATADSFKENTTEAMFLRNKYAEIISEHGVEQGEGYLIVKL